MKNLATCSQFGMEALSSNSVQLSWGHHTDDLEWHHFRTHRYSLWQSHLLPSDRHSELCRMGLGRFLCISYVLPRWETSKTLQNSPKSPSACGDWLRLVQWFSCFDTYHTTNIHHPSDPPDPNPTDPTDFSVDLARSRGPAIPTSCRKCASRRGSTWRVWSPMDRWNLRGEF